MQNIDLKQAAKQADVRIWRLADYLGISEATMTRKLRHELPEEEKQKLLSAIDRLAKEGA